VDAPALLTDHGLALIAVAADPQLDAAGLAEALGRSETAAQTVLDELLDAGYLRREPSGYRVSPALRVSAGRERRLSVDALLAAALGTEPPVRPSRREEVTARLLVAVERLFDQGETYAGVTVERLISEAGLSRSTFYTYFADKADLLQELAAGALEEMLDAATHWWERDQMSSREELHEGTGRIIVAFVKHRVIMRAVSDAAAANATIRSQYVALMERSSGLVARHIRMGQELGFINRDLEPDATGAWINWFAERSLNMIVAPAAPATVERLHTTMTDLYWNVLYADAA
jgi:TetR/AcrR family transcriptional regulator, ethionamide resistance regulator